MLDFLLMHPLITFFAVGAVCALVGLFSYALIFKTKLFDSLSTSPILGPYVAIPGLAFFFMASFISLHQDNRTQLAHDVVAQEESALFVMANIPSLNNPQQLEIQKLLKQYIALSISEEWEAFANTQPSPKVMITLKELLHRINAPEFTCASPDKTNINCLPGQITKQYAQNLDSLINAHDRRIQIGRHYSHISRWLLCFGLMFSAALTILAIHRNSESGGLMALYLFLFSSWMVLGILALHYSPYRGPIPVEFIHLEQIGRSINV